MFLSRLIEVLGFGVITQAKPHKPLNEAETALWQ
jgi:hypothetical protein